MFKSEQFSPFQEIAHGSTGQVFVLKNADELKHFHNFTKTSLAGTAVLDTAVRKQRSKRKKRSTSSKRLLSYIIPIDNCIDAFVITALLTDQVKAECVIKLLEDTIAGIVPSNLDIQLI